MKSVLSYLRCMFLTKSAPQNVWWGVRRVDFRSLRRWETSCLKSTICYKRRSTTFLWKLASNGGGRIKYTILLKCHSHIGAVHFQLRQPCPFYNLDFTGGEGAPDITRKDSVKCQGPYEVCSVQINRLMFEKLAWHSATLKDQTLWADKLAHLSPTKPSVTG